MTCKNTTEHKVAENTARLNDLLTVTAELYEEAWEKREGAVVVNAEKRLFAYVSDADGEQLAKFYFDGSGNWCTADPEYDDPNDLRHDDYFINADFPAVEAAITKWLEPEQGWYLDWNGLTDCDAVKRLDTEAHRYMAAIGRKGGASRSAAKVAAGKANMQRVLANYDSAKRSEAAKKAWATRRAKQK